MEKKLLLQNSFPVNTADEVLYYTLFILERLELMPDQVNTWRSSEALTRAVAFFG